MEKSLSDNDKSASDGDGEVNPFSFKAFLSSVSNLNVNSSRSSINNSTNSTSFTQLNDKLSLNSASEKLTSNSFSFKKFLNETNKAPTLSDSNKSSPVLFQDELPELLTEHLPAAVSPSNHCDLLSNTDLPFTTNCQLPDFVNETIALNDFPENINQDDSDPYKFLDNIPINAKEKTSEINKRSYFDLEPKITFTNNTAKSSTITNINNFNVVQHKEKSKRTNVSSITGTGESEIFSIALKAQLDNLLNEKQTIIDEQAIEIKSLRKQLTELKAKEEQENYALEQVILQIEGNLEKTKKRALEAETLVEKLKAENKQLQEKNQTISNKNKELIEQKLTDANREAHAKSCVEISNNLRISANAAEGFLKQLMNGVNSLKLIADNIESLDKIHEIKD